LGPHHRSLASVDLLGVIFGWSRGLSRLPWSLRIAASFDVTVEFTATYPETAPIIHMNNVAGYLEVNHNGQRAGAAKIAEVVRG